MDDDAGTDQVVPEGTRTGRRLVALPTRSIAVAAAVAVALSGVALGVTLSRGGTGGHAAVTCSPTTPTLKVQGTGMATATPDVLTVVVDVSASAASATAATAADNAKVAAAVAALRGGGVESKDIQTSGLSLQPQYAYPRGVATVTGYQETNTVTATLRDVAGAGAAIDAVVGAGGNAVQIDSVSFSVVDPRAVEDRARARAVTQAVSHARAMAAAAGRALGPVCSLTDETSNTTPPVPETFNAASTSAAPTPSVPIEAGTQTESAQITLVYALAGPTSGGGN